MSLPAAFLFDMDGTLVRTEDVGFDLMQEVLAEQGAVADAEWLAPRFFGRSELDFLETVGRRFPSLNLETVQKAFHERYLPSLQTVDPLPGALDALEVFAERRPLAIVSGSTREQIRTVVEALDLASLVSTLVGCDDVRGKGKPHPAGYLLAAENLGVPAEETLVIEDSEAGVRAGRAAGARVVGVKIGTDGAQDLSAAHHILETLEDLTLDLLKTWYR